MFEYILHENWFELVVVIVAGLLIGLEIKAHRIHKDQNKEIGSVRTFAFIALIGYIFAKIDMLVFMLGYLALFMHLSLFYFHKLKHGKSGIIIFLLSTLVYSFGMVVIKFNIWFLLIIFVAVVFISNLNKRLEKFYKVFNEKEVETFAKLLLLSGVALPLLPQDDISSYIPVSFFKIWLAVVIVSIFSYVGYVLKKYIFNDKGYLVTGILGGIYSSTATTIVLAKKAAKRSNHYLFASSIIIATGIMYIRLLGIAYAFNQDIATKLLLPYTVLATITIIIALTLYKKSKTLPIELKDENEDENPLELGTAFLFAFLFVAMAIITHFVLVQYGNLGLNVLSFIVGFTDVDPFVLSILSSKFEVSTLGATTAILIASGSNNILKALYAYVFSKNKAGYLSSFILLLLGVVTIAVGFIIN